MRGYRLIVCSFWVVRLIAADDLPPGAGGRVASKVCTACHDVDQIRQRRLSRDEWAEIVDDMVDRGAKPTAQEENAILAYLEENFGPNSKLLVNSAPLAEWRSVAGLTVAEARAVLEYRQRNGDFHEIGDLLKVPGVDSRKIEAKREIFSFRQ
jgi:competence ComEA-like helix-hairpin-helix protein